MVRSRRALDLPLPFFPFPFLYSPSLHGATMAITWSSPLPSHGARSLAPSPQPYAQPLAPCAHCTAPVQEYALALWRGVADSRAALPPR
jgi:hypothetical protein